MVFDACVNSDAYERFQRNEKSLIFLMELALSFVSTKHNIDLFSEGYSVPKMKAKGSLAKHVIRRAKQPFIRETASPLHNEKSQTVAEKIEQMKKTSLKANNLNFENNQLNLLKKQFSSPLDEKNPDFIALPKPPCLKLEKQMSLSGKVSCLNIRMELIDLESLIDANCIIEIEQKRFLFLLPKRYFVAIPLPLAIDIKKSKAVFDRTDRTLRVTLPSLLGN